MMNILVGFCGMIKKVELKQEGRGQDTRFKRITYTCTPMFIAALFIIARAWKQHFVAVYLQMG